MSANKDQMSQRKDEKQQQGRDPQNLEQEKKQQGNKPTDEITHDKSREQSAK
ncbi:MAG TPA: hypothetical protein VFV34_23435 [Blastocatellia bacterium]|nr:hypothetical protein [Blastocatellia bacterium]